MFDTEQRRSAVGLWERAPEPAPPSSGGISKPLEGSSEGKRVAAPEAVAQAVDHWVDNGERGAHGGATGPGHAVEPAQADEPGRTFVLLAVTGYQGHGGDDNAMFRAAMQTRRRDIESSPNFRRGVDRIEVRELQDMGRMQGVMARISAENDAAGRDTAEVDIYSHAGYDGPTGSAIASQNQHPDTNSQMTVAGWGEVNYDWARHGARMAFMGCNTGNTNATHAQSFAQQISRLPNMHDVAVAGQPSSAYPSEYADGRSTTAGRELFGYDDDDQVYMVAGNAQDGTSALVGTAEAHRMRVFTNGAEQERQYQPGATSHPAPPEYRLPLTPYRGEGEDDRPLPPIPLLIL